MKTFKIAFVVCCGIFMHDAIKNILRMASDIAIGAIKNSKPKDIYNCGSVYTRKIYKQDRSVDRKIGFGENN